MTYLFPRPSQDSQEQNEVKAWKKKKNVIIMLKCLTILWPQMNYLPIYYWDFSFVIAYAIDLSVYCEQAFYEKWLIRIII